MQSTFKKSVIDEAMRTGKFHQFVPLQAAYGPGFDAGAASSGAFLVGELEKQDPRLIEPFVSYYYPRDIDIIPGGGFVEAVSNVYSDYATASNIEDSIVGKETTNIPVSQANISKDVFKTYKFAEILRLPLFDDLAMQQIGRSLSQILDNGIRLNYNKVLDRNAYVGIAKADTYGLVNSPLIASNYAAQNQAGTSRLWINKTPNEIMYDINSLVTLTWQQCGNDLSGMANHILIDPYNYAYIANNLVSVAGNTSILKYLLENNIAVNQGRTLGIYPSVWCLAAGLGSTQRMAAYVKEPNRVAFDLTVPLTRVMTAPNVQSASYETLYASQISQVKFLAYTCASYLDGI
jgi:hypothetical protein